MSEATTSPTTPDVLARRVAAAARRWRVAPLRERLGILRDAGARLRAREQDLLDCLRADGLSTALARFYGGWILRQGAADLLEHTARELMRTTPAPGETLVRRPDGVVALITPGNSPTINTAPLFSILLAGNGVLMRAPARDGGVRLIASECIGAALADAGHDPALVEVVTGRTRPLLEALYGCAEVDTIVFFGNAEAGRDVAERGHAVGKKVVLELEGSDCMIVWSDGDLEGALDSAMGGYDFSTQPCPIPKHFLVHPGIEADFVHGLRERAAALRTVEADPEGGPLVPMARPARYELLVEEARARGELVVGGYRMDARGEARAEGIYGAPSVALVDHSAGLLRSPLFCEEINVPVLPVVRFGEPEGEAQPTDSEILAAMLELVDGVPFGLRASIWTASDEVAASFVRGLGDVGLLVVNGHHAQHPRFLSPWGGPKRSGGPHGESHLFWQKTSHLQGVVAPAAVVRAALLGPPDKVGLDFVDRVATITLNRPDRHNAIDADLAEQLGEALDRVIAAAEADELRGVILRGAGSSFCSGADLRMLGQLDARGARRFMQEVTWSLRQLERLPVPILALVHGFCVGGGFEFALHCDTIIASEDARFGLPEVQHGLTTTAGAFGRLVRAVGKPRAAHWLLTGERFDAATAHAAGLLAHLVGEGALDEAAARWSTQVRALPRAGVAAGKRLLAGLAGPDTWLPELEGFEGIVRARIDALGRGPRGGGRDDG
ncbi:aldehyde dehydrogenase family protein [Pseudenhygromyxa sp. WMMC2535]|uniref:aldehyde dehydrogenase family protein n=1 Tax=Pseudenhygromyxa sp. WMMC2535 TaxID=2712867 RepID=UPI001553080D|nr:aldehyde dehydrogenase family protein [Pseudenhygromyxa sp. WMMC2535]NVB37539.1 aldehyde dehydrogenase family protein [Pseudenhygromyxa sp. WMMC2535]